MARLVAPKKKPGADDFEILFPESSVSAGSQHFEVREFTIAEGMRLTEVTRDALQKHADGDSRNLIVILAENCGTDALAIAGLDDAEFDSLKAAFEHINRDWLSTLKPTKKGRSERWSNVVQCLIEHGHTLAAVRTYTLRELNLFHEAIQRLHARSRSARIVDVNLGFAGGDAATSQIKSLQRASE